MSAPLHLHRWWQPAENARVPVRFPQWESETVPRLGDPVPLGPNGAKNTPIVV